MQHGSIFQLNQLCQTRWLKTNEIYHLLTSTQEMLSQNLPQKPISGSWFIVPCNLKRGWKQDSYDYLLRSKGSGMREDVEKLKIQGKPLITCLYSYIVPSTLEQSQRQVIMHRRIYKLIDEAKFLFVHYLNSEQANQEKLESGEILDQQQLEQNDSTILNLLISNIDLKQKGTPQSNQNDFLRFEAESVFDNLFVNSFAIEENYQEKINDNWHDNQAKADVQLFIQSQEMCEQKSDQMQLQQIIEKTDLNQVLRFKITQLERRIDSLECERQGASTHFTSQTLNDESRLTIRITEYSPEWDFVEGGIKMVVCFQPMVEVIQGYVLFGEKWSEAVCIQPGVLKCFVPQNEEGCVKLSVLCQGQRIDDISDRPCIFEYRKQKKQKKQKKSGKNILTEDQAYQGEFKVRVIEKLGSLQNYLQQFQPNQQDPQMQMEDFICDDGEKNQRYFTYMFEQFMKIADVYCVPNDKITSFINETDPNGFALIHYLTALGYQSTIKSLLKYKIDIDSVSVDGLTPLQIAVLLNLENMVSFLIHQGAIEAQQPKVNKLFQMEGIYKNKNILDLLVRGVTLSDSINNSSSVTDQRSWNDQEEQEDSNYLSLEELCDQIFIEQLEKDNPQLYPQDQKQGFEEDEDEEDDGEKDDKLIYGQVKPKHHKVNQ